MKTSWKTVTSNFCYKSCRAYYFANAENSNKDGLHNKKQKRKTIIVMAF